MLLRLSLVALFVSLASCGSAPFVEAENLGEQVARARELNVENVATPVRSTRGGRVDLVPNPDGETYDALIRYYDTYWGPHTTVIVDLATGEVSRDEIPSALWQGTTLGPDGKLYGHRTGKTGTLIYTYDPATNKFANLPTEVDMAGETRPLCVGPDDMIYGAGASDSKAVIYQLNPTTGKITEYGKVGPSHAPNRCWGYSVAADDRFVYVASGKIPWYLVAYERATGKETVLLEEAEAKAYLGVSQAGNGAKVIVKTSKGSTYYWVHHGKVTPVTDHANAPWKDSLAKHPAPSRPARPEIGTARIVPKADGRAELWWRNPSDKPKGDVPNNATPQQLGWQFASFEVPTFAATVMRVTAIPDGRIVGSGGNYLGMFIFDPKTGQSTHPGINRLSHYCTTVLGNTVYTSGYPSSALYEWDVNAPWTAGTAANGWEQPPAEQQEASNPQRVSYLAHAGAGTHKMWAAATGADGRVYFGGRWYRDGIGGGFAWFDPKTREAKGINLPFRSYQITHLATAAEGRLIVISTRAVPDRIGKTDQPAQAKLFVFDTAKQEIIREIEPIPNAEFTGDIASATGTRVMGITYDPTHPAELIRDKHSLLYLVDVVTGEMVWQKKLAYPVGFRTNENFARQDGFDFKKGPDGNIWTYTGGETILVNPKKDWHYSYRNCALVRIDPETGDISIVGKLKRPGEMAFSGKDLYLSGGDKYTIDGGEHLRVIRNVLK